MMDFIHSPTVETAKAMLGKLLVYRKSPREIYSGYIVEMEAYLGIEDQAAHGFGGKRTPKIMPLYQPGGTIYLYTMHTHLLLNIVTQTAGQPQGVLIRAIEPRDNVKKMEYNRGKTGVQVSNGPGKLTKAMQLDQALKGTRLSPGTLWIDESQARKPRKIITSARIGIPNKGKWTDAPLRFYVAGNPYVSGLPQKDWLAESAIWQ